MPGRYAKPRPSMDRLKLSTPTASRCRQSRKPRPRALQQNKPRGFRLYKARWLPGLNFLGNKSRDEEPAMSSNSLLSGVKVVSLAINAPGPVAAARLARMGATVTKVEPPGGDPLKTAARAWYDSLCDGQTIVSLDLKESADRAALDRLFSGANLLVVSFRPSALRRLGLDWENLHARHPYLCCAGIIGYPAPFEER